MAPSDEKKPTGAEEAADRPRDAARDPAVGPEEAAKAAETKAEATAPAPAEAKPAADAAAEPAAPPEIEASPAKDEPFVVPPMPRPRPRRRGKLLAIAILLLAAVPAASVICLLANPGKLVLSPATGGSAPSCPTVAGHFKDCYVTQTLEVAAAKPSMKPFWRRYCCDFLAERRTLATLVPPTGAGWAGADPVALDAAKKIDGVSLRLAETAQPAKADLRIDARHVVRVPLVDWLAPRLPDDWRLKFFATVGPLLAGLERRSGETFALAAGGAVAIADGTSELATLRLATRTSPSLLFAELLGGPKAADSPFSILAAKDYPQPAALRTRLAALAPIATETDRMIGQTVSRISASASEQAAAEALGRACIAFYRKARQTFTRYDAALATYFLALPTGLVTAVEDRGPHGCLDGADPAMSDALTADWKALRAPIPEARMESAGAGEPRPADGDLANGTARIEAFLLDFASAAKSGARADALESAFADSVAVNFGGAAKPATKAEVLRMIRRQWSHVGCWLSIPGPGPASVSLLAEAQYPYLNRMLFEIGPEGTVRRLEVTGVTFGELVRTKAENRGRSCQEFLSAARLADYGIWYSRALPGARTPVDHAERLLREGPGRVLVLN